ncbi:putative adenine phosphoribosyltransferase [Basidiobolus meristosporus CBS 931.73]|uniref:adenine phosphoribosyltransferase n=1 Tax=Basidiobolus meristosporus CBS 931.73 TaxID=1314790 RepID=A0A1Y1X7N4_9FUNG|nr:putative adenine phosphoribosyltransferase [Basidiobolus meristosporus CBS 931.73]|eukprot:ORX81762.1 putative adenine phosphoribosyltransferase [Basidiobolus meristosporus CBS 931.73]
MFQDIERVKSLIRVIPDFPQKGIQFQDIFPVFQDPLAVEAIISHFVQHILATHSKKVDVVVGLDARGFLFGPLIALRLGASFVPVRKAGKLPGENIKAIYEKEYGTDEFEMSVGAIKPESNVIVVDDLVATGGSAFAAGELVKKSGGNILEYLFMIELVDLNGVKTLPAPSYALIKV